MAEGRSRGPVVGEYLDRVQQVEGLVGDTVTAFATVLPPRLRDSPTLSCAVAVLIATSETLGVGSLPPSAKYSTGGKTNPDLYPAGWRTFKTYGKATSSARTIAPMPGAKSVLMK